jgi:hypothetical protein
MAQRALIAAAIFLVLGAALTGITYWSESGTPSQPPSMPGLTESGGPLPDADPFAPAAAAPERNVAPERAPASPPNPEAPRRETPAAKPPEPAPPEPVAPPRIASNGLSVIEAALCRDVERETRKPVGVSDSFRARDGRIWCFLKLAGGANRKVRTVWHLGDRDYPGTWLKAGAHGAETWRTWAYKNIDETMTGDGRVDIVDEKGVVLHTMPFRVSP